MSRMEAQGLIQDSERDSSQPLPDWIKDQTGRPAGDLLLLLLSSTWLFPLLPLKSDRLIRATAGIEVASSLSEVSREYGYSMDAHLFILVLHSRRPFREGTSQGLGGGLRRVAAGGGGGESKWTTRNGNSCCASFGASFCASTVCCKKSACKRSFLVEDAVYCCCSCRTMRTGPEASKPIRGQAFASAPAPPLLAGVGDSFFCVGGCHGV